MAVYIAICDDNVADRKHLERMLGREKDSRIPLSQVLYIDSFGSSDALLRMPVKYDMFFLDINSATENAMDVAKHLRADGITAPIVLKSSTIDYSSYVNPPSNVTFTDRDIKKEQLSHLVDVAYNWSISKPPVIEVRSATETRFLLCDEIVLALSKKSETLITLSDGSYFTMLGDTLSLYRLLKPYHSFLFCKKDLINVHHITSTVRNGFVMSDGSKIHYALKQRSFIIDFLAECVSKY